MDGPWVGSGKVLEAGDIMGIGSGRITISRVGSGLKIRTRVQLCVGMSFRFRRPESLTGIAGLLVRAHDKK